MNCDRCPATNSIITCSYFNFDNICRECQNLERNHPLYEKAHQAEVAAVMAGDTNFPGIGKPEDL